MARIGLFGGTFDPVHNGHIAIAKEAFKKLALDEIILIPCGDPPHKTKKDISDKAHRLAMTEMAFSSLGGFSVSDYEIKKQTPCYSVDMLKHFKKLYPDDELFFIIGADSFHDIPTWWHYRELLSLCTIIVVSRPDIDKSELFSRFAGDEAPPRVFYLGNVAYDVSSTQIRAMVYRRQDISKLVPDKVVQYIKKNELYTKH